MPAFTSNSREACVPIKSSKLQIGFRSTVETACCTTPTLKCRVVKEVDQLTWLKQTGQPDAPSVHHHCTSECQSSLVIQKQINSLTFLNPLPLSLSYRSQKLASVTYKFFSSNYGPSHRWPSLVLFFVYF